MSPPFVWGIGLFMAYPFMFVYSFQLRKRPIWLQHVYFIVTGMITSYWVYGWHSVFHNLLCIFTAYFTLLKFRGNFYATLVLAVFQLGYLVMGNIQHEHAIEWVTSHCILTLKLIGTAIDVYDGSRPDQSDNQFKLATVPSLMEMVSHGFFVGGYLVGPVHSLAQFRKALSANTGDLGDSIKEGFMYAFHGIFDTG